MKHWKSYFWAGLLIVVSVVCCSVKNAGAAQLDSKPLNLTLERDAKSKAVAVRHVQFGSEQSVSVADALCKSVVRVITFRSHHPGYGYRVNQNNWGYGFKCRFGDKNPWYGTLGGLINSQSGSTFVVGIGKQFDLLTFLGPFNTEIKYYVGTELDAIAYEWPSRKMIYYGIAPLWHQGVAVRLSGRPSEVFAVVGIEEQRLPIDRIRMYQAYARVVVRF